MKKFTFYAFCLFCLHTQQLNAQNLPPVFGTDYPAEKDSRVRQYLTATRIVWQSDRSGKSIVDAGNLLRPGTGQADLMHKNFCRLISKDGEKPGLVLDFGKEIQGGLQLVTDQPVDHRPIKVRLRFGESVSETMSEVDTISGATNDHAMRDFVIEVPWLGVMQVGNTGFRFVRIDLVDADRELQLKEARAIFEYRDIPYLGSFKSSDDRLNQIWNTGAYTVHLNMQQFLWDGIKRDRLVWVGDMHPEIMTINSVFGQNEVVAKSLDQARDITPLPGWMNGISAYSMWWVLIHRDLYKYQGDLAYLRKQQKYLVELLDLLMSKTKDNKEALDGTRFLDWPSSENPKAIHAGLHAMMVMTLEAGAELCTILDEPAEAKKCKDTAINLKLYVPDANGSKQAAALLALSGLVPAQKANSDVLAVDGCARMSTFYGYYMLQARAKAGDYQGAIDCIRNYWGGMLDMGATTFWEDFDLDWTKNAAPITEVVPDGKDDIHGDFGAYCYKNLRHSLCHGWASGPTSWLSEHVLGVSVLEPGCKSIKVQPNLGDLKWVEGSFPTPMGVVKIRHEKSADGKIKSTIDAPKGVKVVRAGN
ncbi:alpha-L-rhamnosidase C-terminal domain-containing protein [Dyadobacter sp. LHD-138]|uniref:alpha-L-rhamnosidase-related protein n=1 Tax=Dyadobacter sp. LHD-138 TaxID=3071413 RepID=UPI0027E1D97D|nr:alpha-L-rhamnosidase C-terminal domain-containing protein [Dyadobacter sp. LHD-138]MDQ6481577.1 alpha-L-rhamnosidase C-terminal domain-containing protein [Dyadobacter sp. LHD-138]